MDSPQFMLKHQVKKILSQGHIRRAEEVDVEADEAMSRPKRELPMNVEMRTVQRQQEDKNKEQRRSAASGSAVPLRPPGEMDNPLSKLKAHTFAHASPYITGHNSLVPHASSRKPQDSSRILPFKPTPDDRFYGKDAGPSTSPSNGAQKASFSSAAHKQSKAKTYEDIHSHRDGRNAGSNPSKFLQRPSSTNTTKAILKPKAGPSRHSAITNNPTREKSKKETVTIDLVSDEDVGVPVHRRGSTPPGLITHEEKMERKDGDYVDPSSRGKGKSTQQRQRAVLNMVEKRSMQDEDEEEEEERLERGAATRQQRNQENRKGKGRELADQPYHDAIENFPESPRLGRQRQKPSPSDEVEHLELTSEDVRNARIHASDKQSGRMNSREAEQAYSKQRSTGEPDPPLQLTRRKQPMKDSKGNQQPATRLNKPQPTFLSSNQLLSSVENIILLFPNRSAVKQYSVDSACHQKAEFSVDLNADSFVIRHLQNLGSEQLVIPLFSATAVHLVKTTSKSPAMACLLLTIDDQFASSVVDSLGGRQNSIEEISRAVLVVTLLFDEKRWVDMRSTIRQWLSSKGRQDLDVKLPPESVAPVTISALIREAEATLFNSDSSLSAHPSAQGRPKPRPIRDGGSATESRQTTLQFGQQPRKEEEGDSVDRRKPEPRRSHRLSNHHSYADNGDDDAMQSHEYFNRKSPPSDPNTVICVWPAVGRSEIHLTKGDLHRLEEGEYLNDTIIEYGLKDIVSRLDDWLEQAKSSAQQDDSDLEDGWICRTDDVHVFNSFFYKKLSTARGKPGTVATTTDVGEPSIAPWAGYDSVKKWTSKIDIFKKRFVVIPINEHEHWYMAIICNPMQVLTNPKVPSKNTKNIPPTHIKLRSASAKEKPTEEDQASEQLEDQEDKEAKTVRASQTPERRVDAATVCPASEDRSHLDGRGSESSFDDTPRAKRQDPAPVVPAPEASSPAPHRTTASDDDDDECIIADKPLAKPDMGVILMFDSIGVSHRPAASKLNKWLAYEAYYKHSQKQLLSNQVDGPLDYKEVQVPQQPNTRDCGIYLLHFAEVLFRHPRKALQAVVDQKRKQRGENPITLEVWQAVMIAQRRKEWKEKVLNMARAYNPANVAVADEEGAVGDVSQGSVVQVPAPTVADGFGSGSGGISPSKDSSRDDLMDVDEAPNDELMPEQPAKPGLENLPTSSDSRVTKMTDVAPRPAQDSAGKSPARPNGGIGTAFNEAPALHTQSEDEDVILDSPTNAMDVDFPQTQQQHDPAAAHQEKQEEYGYSAPIDNVQQSLQRTSIGPRRFSKAESDGQTANVDEFMVDPSLLHSPASPAAHAASHRSKMPNNRGHDDLDGHASPAFAQAIHNAGFSIRPYHGSRVSAPRGVSPSVDNHADTDSVTSQEDDDDAMASDDTASDLTWEGEQSPANVPEHGDEEAEDWGRDEHLVGLPKVDLPNALLNLRDNEARPQASLSVLVPPRRKLGASTPPPLSPVVPSRSSRSPSVGQIFSAPQSPATRKRRKAEAISSSQGSRSTPQKGVKRAKHWPEHETSEDGELTTAQTESRPAVVASREAIPLRDESPLQPGAPTLPSAARGESGLAAEDSRGAIPPREESPLQPGAPTVPTPRSAAKGTATEPFEIDSEDETTVLRTPTTPNNEFHDTAFSR